MTENKENLRSFFNRALSPLKQKKTLMHTPEKGRHLVYNDSPVLEDSSLWHQQSETTFETIEKMCEKTLSDPENPIHDYLSDWESKRSESGRSDEELMALHRLFGEFGIDNQSNDKLENQTQLIEVEPPSCLWDNTVNNETCLQSSPVKMIGLLRPSTILEESGTDSISSTNSFKSAGQHILDTASSDQYETANESQSQLSRVQKNSAVSSKKRTSSTDSGRSTTSRPDASAYFELFPLRQISYPNQLKEPRIYNQAIFQSEGRYTVESEDSLDSSNDTSRDVSFVSNDSLEKPERRRSKSSKFLEDSLESTKGSSETNRSDRRRVRKSSQTSDETEGGEESSVILISDDETDTTGSDDLNRGFVRGSTVPTDDSVVSSGSSDINVSREFNDTLEEIEYIMNQGKKYMAANKVATTPPKTINYLNVPTSPSPLTSPATPCTVVKKPKPTSANKGISPLHSKAMLKSQRLDHRFDHVVSPIRAYIHNTPNSPMTSTVKATQSIFDSKFSRDSHIPISNDAESEKETGAVGVCTLPRKAYVSADYRHIVDQRSPISIPGGEKIHHYLEPGMLPAVLWHEGKFKTNLPPRQKSNVDMNTESLADFSLASGDMSVLLLRDAKEFSTKH